MYLDITLTRMPFQHLVGKEGKILFSQDKKQRNIYMYMSIENTKKYQKLIDSTHRVTCNNKPLGLIYIFCFFTFCIWFRNSDV